MKVKEEQGPRLVDKVREALDAAGIERDDEELDSNQGVSISVNGNGAHQVAGRDFYDQSTRVEKILPPKVVVKTGDGVLDARQKARLRDLVDEVVAASVSKKEPRERPQIWRQLDHYMGVNSYSEILTEDFEKGITYLTPLEGNEQSSQETEAEREET